jgi:predicted TIM-barrel fold metal-dependent hydrolase
MLLIHPRIITGLLFPLTGGRTRRAASLVLATMATFPSASSRAELPAVDGGPPVPVVDMHTHVFNVLDLPVVELIDATAPVWLPFRRSAVESLAALLNRMASEETRAGFDKTGIRLLAAEPPPKSPPLELAPDERRALERLLSGPQEGFELLQESRPKALDTLSDEELVGEALLRVGFPPLETPLDRKFQAAAPKATILNTLVIGYVEFARLLVRRHQDIAVILQRNQFPNADLFVHHMMDMEMGYGAAPPVPFAAQITNMARLDEQAEGRFLHFVAFDPFRRDTNMTLVKDALNRGAVGVKFYPATGYRATNNVIPPQPKDQHALKRWKSRYDGLTGKALDEINEALFRFCEEKQIPIFTHCTPIGFQAQDGYGWNADPTNWIPVLAAHPKLFLCFGHAGGEAYWFADGKTRKDEENRKRSFGTNVVELCLQYPNVYCEMGYLEDILGTKGRRAFTKRLQEVIDRKSPAGDWTFGDKIMYGTDWHMIHKEQGHKAYLDQFHKVFSERRLRAYHRRFFSGNAVRFLRLADIAQQARFTADQRNHWQHILMNASANP